jgi:DNA-binding transcriptional regulator YiaG
MPNIGQMLKEEIARLAKKQVKKAVVPVRGVLAPLRRAASFMEKRLASLERIVKNLESEAVSRRRSIFTPDSAEVKSARFGPGNVRRLRAKLGVSQQDFGLLAGVATGTVFLWEKGRTSPRGKARASLVELRKIGRREAKRRLAELAPPKKPRGRKRGKK